MINKSSKYIHKFKKYRIINNIHIINQNKYMYLYRILYKFVWYNLGGNAPPPSPEAVSSEI